jgi:hypothetical protein
MAVVTQDRSGVVARLYNPQSWNGSRHDTRTGVLQLDLGDGALVGLTPPVLALRIAQAMVRALEVKYGRPEAPAPLDRGHGVEQVAGQLRLDLLE